MFHHRLFLVISFFLFTQSAIGAAPSGEKWFTIISPHFRVHHTAALEKFARAATQGLERALPMLEKDLFWKAPEQIDIVIMDPSDSANGLAVNFPNTHIELYAVPFETDSALGHYINWVDELTTHELTHIIANDTTRDGYTFLRKVFGSWVKPNGLQPSWLMEGLAVYEETSRSSGGRGRSPLLEAMLRTAVFENKINDPSYISIDRFNDTVPWWPGGNTAYLLGYAIQAGAQKSQDGHHIPGEISFENASRVPFAPNATVDEIAGQDWSTIWANTATKLQARYPKTQNSEMCRLTKSGRFTGGHAVSSDGWIYFSEEDKEQGYYVSRIRIDAPCGNNEVERLFQRHFESPTQLAVSSDGSMVAFVDTDIVDSQKILGDLYLWHRDSKKSEQIIDYGRAKDPAFLGDKLLFVKNTGQVSNDIISLDLQSKAETVLFSSAPLERISGLATQGDKIVFSLHNNNGVERLYTMKVNEKPLPVTRETEPVQYVRSPFLDKNGTIYFAGSFGDGAQHIYAQRPGTEKPDMILAVDNGYLDRPVPVGNDTYIVQGYSLDGLDLYRLKQGANPPKTNTEDLHQFLTGQVPFKKSESPLELPASIPYSATSTPATSLWPQYWLPEITGAYNGWLLGASTGGNDPLEYHRYGGTIQYDTRAGFPTYKVFYENRQNTTSFLFTANQSNSYLSSQKTSNRNATYSAEASVPYHDVYFTVGSAFQERNLFGVRGQSSLFFQQISYRKTGKTPFSMATNRGQSLELFTSVYPTAHSEKMFADIRPKASVYFQGFHPTHSVAFSVLAGITTNRYLTSNYYLGGGASSLSSSAFVVHGYPTDVLLGQRIATANFSYTLPLSHPYRGWGTNPLFVSAVGLRFLADAGTANYVANYVNKGFSFYQSEPFGRQKLIGFGLDLVTSGSVFYHVPLSISLGVHHGLYEKFGGETMLNFGINVGSFGNVGARDHRSDESDVR